MTGRAEDLRDQGGLGRPGSTGFDALRGPDRSGHPGVFGERGEFGGQGECTLFWPKSGPGGFEDCVELDRCLRETGDDFPEALARYGARRKEHADTIAELALDNFVEMRDKVASRSFLLKKRVEHGLERLLPGRYTSRYELVSFSTVPYAEIQPRISRQRRAVAAAALGTLTAVALAVRALRRY